MLDFSKCLYDPSSRKLEERMIEDMEEFNVDLGTDSRHRKSIFKFIIMMYDMESPLRELYPNINHRRREAAFMAGFELNAKGEFSEKIVRMIAGEDDRIIPLITAYLLRVGLVDFVAVEASMSMYMDISKKMIAKTATKDEMEQHRKLLKDIKTYEEEVFRGKEAINIRRALYQGVETARKAPKPEDMAKRLRENPKDKYDDGNPYGDYQVDELKFIGDEPPVS